MIFMNNEIGKPQEIRETMTGPELRELRKRLLTKANWFCSYCGIELDMKSIRIDHAHPKSMGGSHDESNLVACCHSCNASKNAKTADEWKVALLNKSARHVAKAADALCEIDSCFFLDSKDVMDALHALKTAADAVTSARLKFFFEIASGE